MSCSTGFATKKPVAIELHTLLHEKQRYIHKRIREKYKKMTTVEGMLDIGKHCTICRQLDFLPFECRICSKCFCGKHRDEYNQHKCVVDAQRKKVLEREKMKVDVSQLPKASELFPDLEKIRAEAQTKYEKDKKKTIGERLSKDGGNEKLASIEVAMLRLKKLLGNTRVVAESRPGIFGFKKTSSKASQVVEMNKLKRSAIGDGRVPIGDRVYVWVHFNDDEDCKFNGRNSQYFSKKWPVGKMLDSSAQLANIKNLNNQTVDESLKLAMFKRVKKTGNVTADEEFVYIPLNGRVENEIRDGDEIYILRGKR